jgi:hypothetical protein
VNTCVCVCTIMKKQTISSRKVNKEELVKEATLIRRYVLTQYPHSYTLNDTKNKELRIVLTKHVY